MGSLCIVLFLSCFAVTVGNLEWLLLGECLHHVYGQWEDDGRIPLSCDSVQCLEISQLQGSSFKKKRQK